MFEKYYTPEQFPEFKYYAGDPSSYIVFLVLRFYDDPEDFKVKLRSAFPHVRVFHVRKPLRFWEKAVMVKNTLNGQIVELNKKDDPFTTAVKLFRVIAGVEWLQEPAFFKAFEEVLPGVIWKGVPLIPGGHTIL